MLVIDPNMTAEIKVTADDMRQAEQAIRDRRDAEFRAIVQRLNQDVADAAVAAGAMTREQADEILGESGKGGVG